MILYRPVGLAELRLIYERDMRAFPPRLPDQPIFYPVLNFTYAAQISREWNAKSAPFAGYVTEFAVDDDYVSRYERQVVGSRIHEELWVPAEDLTKRIAAPITVTAAFFGPEFAGHRPTAGRMQGLDAAGQFALLADLPDDKALDDEITANHLAVFLHYQFWRERDFAGIGPERKARALEQIARIWRQRYPAIGLPEAR